MSLETNNRWVVLKFGGTSVSSRGCWDVISSQVKQRLDEGYRVFLVQSALQGVSDRLEAYLEYPGAQKSCEILEEIKALHYRLAQELGVDGTACLEKHLGELERLLVGIELTGDASFSTHARVLALGELMASSLGAQFLQTQGLPARWFDARHGLTAVSNGAQSERRRYLEVSCEYRPDVGLQEELAALGTVIVSQGFIASGKNGSTVLLGRGGSDTSAAYFAAKLAAKRVEIWTDVPGLFSANPRIIPHARLLRSVDYVEAQEIATSGAKVLHPRCIPPAREYKIPVWIRSTQDPSLPGTKIETHSAGSTYRLKAISYRRGVTLLSLETLQMWHQAGFLAEFFACFKAHDLSLDLVSTSEANVTVSLDQAGNTQDEALNRVVDDLSKIGRVEVISGCAAISLVGRNIRAILHRLGPTLRVFEHEKVHLISQAANDLNLTIVVDESHSERLVQTLHNLLIETQIPDKAEGESWDELHKKYRSNAPSGYWWIEKKEELLELAPANRAVYVYNKPSVEQAWKRLKTLSSVDRILYSVKANNHPEILTLLYNLGSSFECVSQPEIELLLKLFPDIEPDRILFTPNFAARAEYEWALHRGIPLTCDSLYPFTNWQDLLRGCSLFVRIDPGVGHGHHAHVKTAGSQSKFGIALGDLPELAKLIDKLEINVTGLHCHAGSGERNVDTWLDSVRALASCAEFFPSLKVFDIGGGFGVPERPQQPALDLERLNQIFTEFKTAFPNQEIWIEPGRYLVSECGVLLSRVTQTKAKPGTHYVGINTGMNSLIRPALYGAYHQIFNLSRLDESSHQMVDVVGPICESGDRIGTARTLPRCKEDDVLLIANTGAYGAVMSSNYNLRPPAEAVFIPCET